MSIELPPIPSMPNEDSTPEQWVRYLDIARLHVSQESSSAINSQTAQMVLMTAAAENNAAVMQQLLQHLLDAPAPSPTPAAGSDAARVVVAALMSEAGGDREPSAVATAVLARVAAVDTMLGGEVASG